MVKSDIPLRRRPAQRRPARRHRQLSVGRAGRTRAGDPPHRPRGLPFAAYGKPQSIAVQVHSTDGLRGRVISLTFGAQVVAQLIGVGAAGPLAALLGPETINAEALAYLAAGALALKAARRQVPVP